MDFDRPIGLVVRPGRTENFTSADIAQILVPTRALFRTAPAQEE
jgi:hypothetical protein